MAPSLLESACMLDTKWLRFFLVSRKPQTSKSHVTPAVPFNGWGSRSNGKDDLQ